jgi:hypothetical protein
MEQSYAVLVFLIDGDIASEFARERANVVNQLFRICFRNGMKL